MIMMKTQLKNTVEKVLQDLDLYEIKDLQVGDIMNKKVSGGQRKRLNIGLELMREPVVFLLMSQHQDYHHSILKK